jgi:hypothetical protein
MAFTLTEVKKGVVGDLRYEILSVDIDSASGNIQTGLQTIYGAAIAPKSAATAGIMLRLNIGSNSTARAGIANVNSGTNGDVFVITFYGK